MVSVQLVLELGLFICIRRNSVFHFPSPFCPNWSLDLFPDQLPDLWLPTDSLNGRPQQEMAEVELSPCEVSVVSCFL
jgi:hypothetical protein